MKYRIFVFVFIFFIAKVSFAQVTPVYVVLFTHIEDNTPSGALGTSECKQQYLLLRNKMISMANLAKSYDVKWSFEPDWKLLEAALIYEDTTIIKSTNNKNFLRYLKEDLGVAIDPHSHEKSGYNYTDVAHLLDSLGVGATKVIGGHVWDPNLTQFQNWDRFRVPVKGTKYPWAVWRGEILMGSGTPNHVNDPLVTGVWRPKDKLNYFVDDPNGNIFCIGKYIGDITSTTELINLYKNKKVSESCMLTSSYHIKPADITSQFGLRAIEDTVLKPLTTLRNGGEVVLTDFTALIQEWKSLFNSNACIYDPAGTTNVDIGNTEVLDLDKCYPNPFSNRIIIKGISGDTQYELFDSRGHIIWSGKNIEQSDFSYLANDLYFVKVKNKNLIKLIKIIK
ncbi:MAG: T9SS type A sorting domain-containing protein [Bacteroidota bacterium]